MAETFKALFAATENISDALDEISSSTEITKTKTSELQRQLQELGGAGQITREAFDNLRNSASELSAAADVVDDNIDDVNVALHKLDAGGIKSEEALNELERSMNSLFRAARTTDESARGLKSELNDLAEAGLVTNQANKKLSRSINSINRNSIFSSRAVRSLSDAMVETNVVADRAESNTSSYSRAIKSMSGAAVGALIPQQALSQSVENTKDNMEEASREVKSLSKDLGILSSIAAASSLSFSSLSVNIGPFNLALRNILIQLPAILTGMGALLAVVTSLATAFLTLGAALGAFVGASAIVFFQDFQKQFEDTQEAIEALTGALKDLFVDAIEPLTSEFDGSLFITVINEMAQAIHVLSQFFAQMKDEIFDFLGGIEGDLSGTFEALHDSFVMLTPILQDVINWFLQGFPDALMTFSRFTKSVSDEVGSMVNAFVDLFFELLTFAQMLISTLGPAISNIISSLSTVFSVINSIPSIITSVILKGLILAAVLVKLRSIIASVKGGFATLTAVMKAHAVTGSLVANVYMALRGVMIQLWRGNMTLSQSYKVLSAAIWRNVAATKANIMSKLRAVKTNLIAAASYIGLAGAMETATAAAWSFWTAITGGMLPLIIAIAGAITIAIAAFKNMGGIMDIISGTIGFFTDIIKGLAKFIGTMLIPIINMMLIPLQAWVSIFETIGSLIADIINRILEFIGVADGMGGAIAGAFDVVLSVVELLNDVLGWVIDKINMIPGVDIEGPALEAKAVSDALEDDTEESDDDIQTEQNVDLSFEDKLEQNVDVQADPEDKAQLSRITKDAIEEANSFARRQQGNSG